MSRIRVGAAVAAVVVLAAVGTGCDHPHVPTLSNGSVSDCYRAIPAASTALLADPKAKLLGVHRLSADDAARHISAADKAIVDRSRSGASFDNDTSVCAVAWKGTFAPGQVTAAAPTSSGSYAIVLITTHGLRVLNSFVVKQIPKRLRGRFA